MTKKEQTKEMIEKQFNDLFIKAKQLYPDIDEVILSYTNTVAYTECLQEYLNLIMQTSPETSTNYIFT
jgi:hypothetical protein